MRFLLAYLLVASLPLALASAGEHFACNAKALTAEERARYQELMQTLFAAVDEKKELTDGYAFRVPSSMLVSAATWVAYERRCCPFFTFQIEQTRDEGPVWLKITGPEGIKAFIRAEIEG